MALPSLLSEQILVFAFAEVLEGLVGAGQGEGEKQCPLPGKTITRREGDHIGLEPSRGKGFVHVLSCLR